MILAIGFKVEYVIDIVFLLAIVVWALVDAKKGFIGCFFSFISAIVCATAVLFLTGPVLRLTGGLFGLEKTIQGGLGDWLSTIPMGNIDISTSGWMEKMETLGLPQFIKDEVLKEISTITGTIPEGTMLGQYIGSAVGSFLALVICGILVLLITKLLMMLTRGILNSIAKASPFIWKINMVGGILAGAFKAVAMTCVILSILAVIPVEGISNFFDNTLLLKDWYHNNPMMTIYSWFTKM